MASPSTIIIVVLSIFISLLSFIIALLVYLIRRREPWAQSLIKIMDRLETDEIRNIRRKIIYRIQRESEGEWVATNHTPEQTKDGIDRWGAEMDLLALLYFSKQFNPVEFFEIYGDVVLRTAYQLAPYANKQRLERGEQFWLPFQKLTLALLGLWSKRANKGLYPEQIGFPGNPTRITPSEFKNDVHVRQFIQASSLKIKR